MCVGQRIERLPGTRLRVQGYPQFGRDLHGARRFVQFEHNLHCVAGFHTGNLAAATRAIETLDECLGRAIGAMRATGGEVLITADHGNAETMLDPETGQPHTAHTTNLVPLLYVGREARIAASGALADIAPTLLAMMGVPQPPEMTGKALLAFR